VEDLSHVINFDVPHVPEDYIHRVGRTARAEATGDAFTFVAPDEEDDLRKIERAIGKRLPRILVPDFDYAVRPGKDADSSMRRERSPAWARGASRPGPRPDARPGERGAPRSNERHSYRGPRSDSRAPSGGQHSAPRQAHSTAPRPASPSRPGAPPRDAQRAPKSSPGRFTRGPRRGFHGGR
jgi:ATP-dependent RNA helicase RhlE